MSAHVLRSPHPTTATSEPAPGAPSPAHAAAAIEPSLVNRLLGVAAAVFAVPVLLELRRLVAAPASGPTDAQEATLFAASALLAVAFALVLRRAPRLADLRTGRALFATLALEAAALGAAWIAHLAR